MKEKRKVYGTKIIITRKRSSKKFREVAFKGMDFVDILLSNATTLWYVVGLRWKAKKVIVHGKNIVTCKVSKS